ncbi:MAG: porin family protein [Verrucomicrobiota bacterium]|nr:porin family protein [Verrucomicrobiota bacterium]
MAPRTTEDCFRDHEFQVDVFGIGAAALSNQERIIGDHAFGAGIGLNYFFSRNLGVGLEGNWLSPSSDKDDIGTAGLNVFVRFPCKDTCFAPYAFLGPDVVFNADEVARGDTPQHSNNDAFLAGHAGLGVEYRFNRTVGIFVDGRYTVVEKGHNDFGSVRTGFRFAF